MNTNGNGIEFISGGVVAAKGFRAAGIHAGIRKNKTKKDLALIMADKPVSAAAVYTRNLVKGAPLTVTAEHLKNGRAQAIICNSGNANTCNADGIEIAEATCDILAEAAGIAADDVIVASTGVIGQPLSIEPFKRGIPLLVEALGADSAGANEAIMTTDTVIKEVAVKFTLGGKECHIGGIAKGSGMIHPNMATMLVFVTADAAISPAILAEIVRKDVVTSFNMVSVDGDTSTNDMLAVMASGEAGNAEITEYNEDAEKFAEAFGVVTRALCRKIAADGEGATKLIECKVSGALNDETARVVAKSVITSSLIKTAMFGADANWGRVLCAIGYAGTDTDINKVGVVFRSEAGVVEVCRDGHGVDFSEELAKKVLTEKGIIIDITLGDGDGEAVAWGCDLTYEYVKINGDYRT